MSGEEGFLDRWSRRKRAAAATELHAPAETPPLEVPAPAEEPETLPPEELAKLPPVEAIDADTDLAQFLRKGVPRVLRNAALRRKWMLNAAIRDHRDIAVDYAWDWNVPGGVPGDGGPLGPDAVARMARALLGPERDEATATAAPPPETPAEAAAAPAEADEPASAPAVPGEPAPAVPATAADRPRSDPPPQRRHGGAAPV
jgi:hypothetical protein